MIARTDLRLGPLIAAVVGCVAACAAAWSSESAERHAYEVITETSMPHLEENLRYTTTKQEHCLDDAALFRAFPMLAHDSMRNCRLVEEGQDAQVRTFRLVCSGTQSTTGRATWHLSAHQKVGTLEVKLGGKNMTFSQRVTAKELDKKCDV